MSTYKFILNVMFAIYLFNLFSHWLFEAFVLGMSHNPTLDLWADAVLGVILLALVIHANRRSLR